MIYGLKFCIKMPLVPINLYAKFGAIGPKCLVVAWPNVLTYLKMQNFAPLILQFWPVILSFWVLDHCKILHSSKYTNRESIPKACIKIHAILVEKIWKLSLEGKSKILKKFKIEFWQNGLSQANEIFLVVSYQGQVWQRKISCYWDS